MADTSTFHGLPVLEAEGQIYLRAVEEDGGEPGDPIGCRWARAAHRMYGGLAAFFRTVAYIEIEPGEIRRFAVSPKVRKLIENFDETGEMPSGTFLFGPVTGRRTLDARRAENRRLADPDRKPHVSRKLATGTGNGRTPAVTTRARGGYVPALHR